MNENALISQEIETQFTSPTDEANLSKPTNIDDALQSVVDNLNEIEAEIETKFHDWSTENVTVRTLIKRYQEGKFKLPLCQRLYVWNEKMRLSLYESVKQNLPCGTIIITEADNTQYLLDGLQRTTSLMLLSNDKEHFTADERKSILDYKVTLTIVHDMSVQGMKNYFSVLNSGMALASSVKERSKLSDELNDAILNISACKIFRTTSTSVTFSKAHHHELIAMNTLLAVAGCGIGDNKAKSLCARLAANSEAVLSNIDKAEIIINRIETIISELSEDIATRSMNANFLGTLVYVIVKNQQYDNCSIKEIVNYIFGDKRAIKEYSVTTSSGAGDENKCKQRYDVIIKLLSDPAVKYFNEDDFNRYKKEQRGTVVKDDAGTYIVDFGEFEECEQKALYAAKQGNAKLYNKLIKQKYEQLEQQVVE